MSIKENTIVSTTDTKVTLLQWLKDTNKALENDTLTGVEVRQKGNATFSFVLTFKDGSVLESNEFVLAQGESINGATIRNGHLYLSLTNGNELDAGDLKPVTSFAINESQHLIVNYGDGTSQDLGSIFNGNVNINGNFTANSIVENMGGYSFVSKNIHADFTPIYVGAVKNGNKITCVWFFSIKPTENSYSGAKMGDINMPSSVLSKLYPFSLSGIDNLLDVKVVPLYSGYTQKIEGNLILQKFNGSILPRLYINNLVVGTSYLLRYEVTFLLSDNLAIA